jgi:uncharacterized protein (TIGR02722 family)
MRGYRIVSLLAAAGSLLLAGGCASTGVQRIGPDRERPLTYKFEADDARQTVEKMVDSMLVFPPLVERCAGSRPVVDVASLKNGTMQHIDTVSLTDSIRTKLIRSGKFRFKDRSTAGTDVTVINEENELGLVDASRAVKAGQQIATELYLYGNISEIKQTAGRLIDQYYKITLNMKDLRTGEILWSDEQEIRKEQKRPLI